MTELTIRGERVLIDGSLRPAAIRVRDGRIAEIVRPNEIGAGVDVHDAGDAVVMAGLVDTHVHVNEPGRADWEGFETATRAAAAGGVTTVLDMPLNSIPATTTVAALEEKRAAARARCHVDVGFIGGVVPDNGRELEALARAGVLAFKCFLVESGVEEFQHVSERDLRAAMPVLASLGLPLMVHAELPEPIRRAVAALGADADPRCYATWLMTRPPEAEEDAIRLLVALSRETRARVHIVHVAAAGAIPLLRAARREGLPVTAETCPHYLVFSADSIPDGATHFKCAPPIRERAHTEALWAALREGDLDMIASDHSPCPPSLKLSAEGNCLRAWGGIASIQLTLPAVWTCAPAHGVTVPDVARWMSDRPAQIAGLSARKGSIARGRDADLVLWEPEQGFTVDARTLQHRHKLTPYQGMRLRGIVRETWLRGERIYDRGDFPAPPRGTFLHSGDV
ncbi:MAG: allantoinase AllB [Gemmatimonadota bacterium]|nr:allantoinase AllB [Gemmatimonadota bacterium]